jgi:hypothetical protein
MLVVGNSYDSQAGLWRFAVARLNADGSLDDGGTGDTTPGDQFGRTAA